MKKTFIPAQDWERDDHSRTSTYPKSKTERWFRVVRWWWYRSMSRIVLTEIYSLPFRIRALLINSLLRFCGPVPSHPLPADQITWNEVFDFAHAYNDDMQRLSKKHPWITVLDLIVAAESYRLGAAYGFRNAHKLQGSKALTITAENATEVQLKITALEKALQTYEPNLLQAYKKELDDLRKSAGPALNPAGVEALRSALLRE